MTHLVLSDSTNKTVLSMDQQIANLSDLGSNAIDPMAGLSIPLMRMYPSMEMSNSRRLAGGDGRDRGTLGINSTIGDFGLEKS